MALLAIPLPGSTRDGNCCWIEADLYVFQSEPGKLISKSEREPVGTRTRELISNIPELARSDANSRILFHQISFFLGRSSSLSQIYFWFHTDHFNKGEGVTIDGKELKATHLSQPVCC